MTKENLEASFYDISSTGHLARAVWIRDNFLRGGPLQLRMQFGIYIALELRNAIERLLFEYLVLINGDSVSRTMEKEYRAVSLKKYIEEVEPELQAKIEYTNLMLRAIGMPLAVVPDFDALSAVYGSLNNYLHAWKRPQKTAGNRAWWTNLFTELQKAEKLLMQIRAGTMGHVKFDKKGREQYEAWKKHEVSDDEVIERFRRESGKRR